MQGVKYRHQDGKSGWHVTVDASDGETHSFWVDGSDFSEVTHYMMQRGSDSDVLSFGNVITDIEAEERAAIQEAIAAWDLAQVSNRQ